jgi:hypothetical protein
MASATAAGTTYVWDGSSNTRWSTQDNWTAGALFPDYWSDGADSATVDDRDSPGNWPALDGTYSIQTLLMGDGTSGDSTKIYTEYDSTTYTLTVSSVFAVEDPNSSCYIEQLGDGEIDAASCTITAADTNDYDATLKLSDGTLDVNGTVQLNASTSADAEAWLVVASDAIFEPDDLDLNGGDTADRRAGLDLSEDVLVESATSTDIDGYADINITTGKTLWARATVIGSSQNVESYVRINQNGQTGEFDADSMTLWTGDAANEDVYLQVCNGTLDVNGEVELNGSTSVDAEAELEVSSGATLSPDYFDVNGGDSSNRCAVLDCNESVTVQSSGTDFEGYCDIDIATYKTFTALGTTVNAANGVSDVMIGAESGTGTFLATTLFITAGDGAGEDARFRHSYGTGTISGELEMNASTSVNAEAELYVAATATAFSAGAADFNGGSSSSQRVVLDFDQSVSSGASDFDGYCSIDIADGKTFTSNGNIRFGSDDTVTNVVIGSSDSEEGTLLMAEDADISIEGGDSDGESTTVTVNYGTLDADNCCRVRIREGSYAGDTDYAALVIASTAAVEFDDVAMQNDASLTLNVSATVDDDFEVSASGSTAPSLTLADDKTLTINGTFAIEAGANDISFAPTFNGGEISVTGL